MGGFGNVLSGRRGLGIIAAAAVAVIAAVAVALIFATRSSPASEPAGETPTATATRTTPTATATASPTPDTVRFAGILDGVPMTEAEWQARKDLLPIAVMIDNTPNSYPHAGLDRADLIYEALVEGGITRLMAVYWRHEADLIMPVRSARTPFVIWVDELGALYAHAGSATTTNEANAAGQIIEWGIKDLNAFSPGSNAAYYRDTSRYAPYNLATSTGALRQAAVALGLSGPPAVESWKFRNPSDPPASGAPAEGIEVDFSGRRNAWQLIQWKWDPERRAYGRYQFGGPFTDAASGNQLFATTVIVMRTEARVVDDSGHVLLDQFGEGPATVFTGGRAIEGTWRKADRKAHTRFYDRAGNEIAFERGPTFIEVISQTGEFSITASAADLPPLPTYVPPPPSAGPIEDDDLPPEPTATPTPEPPTLTPSPSPMAPSPTAPAASPLPDSGSATAPANGSPTSTP
ncbi:DUF3048 domain-containing protein [Tepidiforma sp.]|uniref:DUF3048 domain-containing protein n=1 Tax=Tepidiforma sp. TaxID=2682230 RepID=UPI002ADE8E81|nr:DUF3048 domain-containing protein [Tepidiforma sp.]